MILLKFLDVHCKFTNKKQITFYRYDSQQTLVNLVLLNGFAYFHPNNNHQLQQFSKNGVEYIANTE